MSTTTLPSAMEAARQRLDAWVREVMEWHFDPATGCPFWLDGREGRLGPAQGRQRLRRPRQVRRLPGRVAARRPGPALGAEGLRGQARLRSSRPAAAPACRSRASASTTSASTTRTSATRCPTTRFRKGADWLTSARAARAACAWPSSTWRSTAAASASCVDLDPRWVIKLIKCQRDGAVEALQAPRHRSGADAAARRTTTSSACSPRRSCSRRCARRCR